MSVLSSTQDLPERTITRKKMKNEGDVKKAVKKIFARFGDQLWYYMPAANGYGRAGIPDFIGCYRGHFFAVETKFGSNDLSTNQVREVQNLKVADAQVWIVRESTLEAFESEFTAWVALCS